MSHAIGMQVVMKAVHGKGDDLVQTMQLAANTVVLLPGCQQYLLFRGMADPDVIMVTEIWDSQADHQAALAHADIVRIVNHARPMIEHMQHHVGRPLV